MLLIDVCYIIHGSAVIIIFIILIPLALCSFDKLSARPFLSLFRSPSIDIYLPMSVVTIVLAVMQEKYN